MSVTEFKFLCACCGEGGRPAGRWAFADDHGHSMRQSELSKMVADGAKALKEHGLVGVYCACEREGL